MTEISYKMRKDNLAANALSTLLEDTITLFALSILHTNWIEEVKKEWHHDPHLSKLIQELEADPTLHKHYSRHGGLLLHKNSPIIPTK